MATYRAEWPPPTIRGSTEVLEYRAAIPFLRTLRLAVGVVEDLTVFMPLDLITLTDAGVRFVHAGRNHIYILFATAGMGVPAAYCSHSRRSRAVLLVIAPDDEKANQCQSNSNDTSGREAQSFHLILFISFGETGSGQ